MNVLWKESPKCYLGSRRTLEAIHFAITFLRKSAYLGIDRFCFTWMGTVRIFWNYDGMWMSTLERIIFKHPASMVGGSWPRRSCLSHCAEVPHHNIIACVCLIMGCCLGYSPLTWRPRPASYLFLPSVLFYQQPVNLAVMCGSDRRHWEALGWGSRCKLQGSMAGLLLILLWKLLFHFHPCRVYKTWIFGFVCEGRNLQWLSTFA